MNVLFVDCYVDAKSSLHSFAPVMQTLGHTVTHWHVSQGVAMPNVTIDCIVISGSAASVVDFALFPWLYTLEGVLRDAFARAIPCLGICFGHQLLAKLLGCVVQNTGNPEVGWKEIHCVPSALWKDMPLQFGAFLSHEDAVVEVSSVVRVVASSRECAIQAFEHTELPVFGLQFHPEMLIEEARYLLEWRKDRHENISIDLGYELSLLQANPYKKQIFQNFFALAQREKAEI